MPLVSEYDAPGRDVTTEGGGTLNVSVGRRVLSRRWSVVVRSTDGEKVIDEACADRDEALMRADYWAQRLSGTL